MERMQRFGCSLDSKSIQILKNRNPRTKKKDDSFQRVTVAVDCELDWTESGWAGFRHRWRKHESAGGTAVGTAVTTFSGGRQPLRQKWKFKNKLPPSYANHSRFGVGPWTLPCLHEHHEQILLCNTHTHSSSQNREGTRVCTNHSRANHTRIMMMILISLALIECNEKWSSHCQLIYPRTLMFVFLFFCPLRTHSEFGPTKKTWLVSIWLKTYFALRVAES